MSEKIPIDPLMDLTKDMDYVTGSRGITYFFTDTKTLPKELFAKYVKKKSFIDLGAGDGRILEFVKKCGCNYYRGVEIDRAFVKGAYQRYIIIDDLKNIPIRRYDVIFYYLRSDHAGEMDLLRKIDDEFTGTIMIYYRKVEHHIEDFKKALELCGFEEVDSAENLKVFQKRTA